MPILDPHQVGKADGQTTTKLWRDVTVSATAIAPEFAREMHGSGDAPLGRQRSLIGFQASCPMCSGGQRLSDLTRTHFNTSKPLSRLDIRPRFPARCPVYFHLS
jgi:hypothetical protein